MTASSLKPTVFAFIDGQNLQKGITSQGWKLDWQKFRQYLRHKYDVSDAYLFLGKIPGNESLYVHLSRIGYSLILKPTLTRFEKGKKVVKGNIDAELVLHTMIHYSDFDQAVIISGDGDFFCLVEYLHAHKKLCRLLVPNRHYSRLLSRFHSHLSVVTDIQTSVQVTKMTKISGRSKP